jgi:hypothetical protein
LWFVFARVLYTESSSGEEESSSGEEEESSSEEEGGEGEEKVCSCRFVFVVFLLF